MKKTKNFNISVPELGDKPDITQVSNAIQDLEDALAGTLEVMTASIQGSALTLTSGARTTKRTKYYEGMAIKFVAPIQINPNSVTTVTVDDLDAQTLEIPYLVNAGDSTDIVYKGTKFIGTITAIQRSNAVDSESTATVGTSKAVKTAYDKAMEAFTYAKSLCPYRVGDILITNVKENPAVTWVGTSWTRIEGRSLRATAGDQESGLLLGSDSVTLSVDNMPQHTHGATASTDAQGAHTHGASGSADTQGWHSHNANHNHSAWQDGHAHTQPAHTHPINWNVGYDGSGPITRSRWGVSGTSADHIHAAGGENTGGAQPAVYVNAANFDVSGNGSHSHNISVGIHEAGSHSHNVGISIHNAGGGSAFSVLNASYTVHMWLRTE